VLYFSPVSRLATIIRFLLILLAGNSAFAGGSGLNVIVVVNQHSTNSVQLANDYCELRGVPPQNVLRLTNWTGSNINWSPGDFTTNLLYPLLAMTASRGLTNQAQFVLLSMDLPYRVTGATGDNSTTSALFYGFKTNGAPVGGYASCSLPDNTSNSYAYSETRFPEAPPGTAATNAFLAMMLTDTNLTAAEKTLAQAVAADHSFPTQTVYLAKSSDNVRNVRFTEYDNSVFENQVISNFSVTRIQTDNTLYTNLAGFMTGLSGFSVATNEFVPGALADNLTSFGGFILENAGQTTLLAFLEGGAVGSYGTIVEPCNYTQKFPDPVDYFYQVRGFSLAEAYYQSVLNPYQGLLVGEPLTAPFAQPATAGWSSLTNGTGLSGHTNLTVNFSAVATNRPLTRVDLFVDGTFLQTLTNFPPAASNVLSATVNGQLISYTVPTNATLTSVASGLAAALNTQSNVTHVLAFPVGDRIELQSLSLYTAGSNVTVAVSNAIGSAASLTARLSAARTNFLDSVARGYQVVTFYNSPAVGDWLQLTLIKTNGVHVTLAVTNTVSGTTIGALVQNLFSQINTNPALTATDGALADDFFDADSYGAAAAQFFLYARTNGWPAAQILAMLTTSTNLFSTPGGINPLADNVNDLRPRNHLYVSAGLNSPTVTFALDTTQLPDGYHQLAAVAYEGTSVATQARVTRDVQIQNTSLSATFSALPLGTNATLGQSLQFTVAASATNIARVELFSTGGSIELTTNQPNATFTVSTSFLGLGLHPFYALVTDTGGHRYQTPTVWYRILPAIALTLAKTPPEVSWNALIGRQYDLQFTTNLAAGFQTLVTTTATNTLMQWPIVLTNRAGFYRVQLKP
jgi:uncharacterized protein (TIGR03790 family)